MEKKSKHRKVVLVERYIPVFFSYFIFHLFFSFWDDGVTKRSVNYHDNFMINSVCASVQIRQTKKNSWLVEQNLEKKTKWKKKTRTMAKQKGKQYNSCIEFRIMSFQFEICFFFAVHIHNIHWKCDGIFHAIDICAITAVAVAVAVAVEPLPLIYGLFAVLIIKCSNWNRHIWSIIIICVWHCLSLTVYVYSPTVWGSPLLYDWIEINSLTVYKFVNTDRE